MRPTHFPGDFVWLDFRRKVRAGDVVAARFPDGTHVIKRAAERRERPDGSPGWWLLGDNPEESVDSRHRGVIPDEDVIAVVRFRFPRLLSRRGQRVGVRRRRGR